MVNVSFLQAHVAAFRSELSHASDSLASASAHLLAVMRASTAHECSEMLVREDVGALLAKLTPAQSQPIVARRWEAMLDDDDRDKLKAAREQPSTVIAPRPLKLAEVHQLNEVLLASVDTNMLLLGLRACEKTVEAPMESRAAIVAIWLPRALQLINSSVVDVALAAVEAVAIAFVRQRNEALLTVEQKSNLAETALRLLPPFDTPAKCVTAARVCRLASLEQLDRLLPLIVGITNREAIDPDTLKRCCRNLCDLTKSPQAAATALPLLLAHGVTDAMVRCFTHTDTDVSAYAAICIAGIVRRSSAAVPVSASLTNAGLFALANVRPVLTHLEKRVRHKMARTFAKLHADVVSSPLAQEAEFMGLLVKLLEEQERVMAPNVCFLLSSMIHSALEATHPLLLAYSPASPNSLKQNRAILRVLRIVLEWEECKAVTAQRQLHPFCLQLLQSGGVPWLEGRVNHTLWQSRTLVLRARSRLAFSVVFSFCLCVCVADMVRLPAPVASCEDVSQQLRLADFLRKHMYGRMAVGTANWLVQRHLQRHSPLNLHTCGAVAPHWFQQRYAALKQMRRVEQLAAQLQEELLEQQQQQQAGQEDGEEED